MSLSFTSLSSICLFLCHSLIHHLTFLSPFLPPNHTHSPLTSTLLSDVYYYESGIISDELVEPVFAVGSVLPAPEAGEEGEAVQLRSYFPETWLWELSFIPLVSGRKECYCLLVAHCSYSYFSSPLYSQFAVGTKEKGAPNCLLFFLLLHIINCIKYLLMILLVYGRKGNNITHGS